MCPVTVCVGAAEAAEEVPHPACAAQGEPDQGSAVEVGGGAAAYDIRRQR